jgi:hypothetical protein
LPRDIFSWNGFIPAKKVGYLAQFGIIHLHHSRTVAGKFDGYAYILKKAGGYLNKAAEIADWSHVRKLLTGCPIF